MRQMKRALMCVTLCAFACGIGAGQDIHTATAKECQVDLERPAKQVFARIDDGHSWRTYKTLGDVPELSLDSGVSVEAWTGQTGRLLIRTVEPGEDFWRYTEYCFDKEGRLDRVSLEVRTAWGWAFRTWGQVKGTVLHAESSAYFGTKSNTRIPKPEGADDISAALKPRLYPETTKLPFFKLLSK